MTKINIQCILTYWLLNDQKKIRSSLTLKFTPKFGFCHTNSFKPVITAPVSSLKSVYYKSLFLKKRPNKDYFFWKYWPKFENISAKSVKLRIGLLCQIGLFKKINLDDGKFQVCLGVSKNTDVLIEYRPFTYHF